MRTKSELILLVLWCVATLVGCASTSETPGEDPMAYERQLDPGWRGVALTYRVVPARPGDPTRLDDVNRSRRILVERFTSAAVDGAEVHVSGPDTLEVLVPESVWNLPRVKRLTETPGHLSFHVVVTRPGLAPYDSIRIKDHEKPETTVRVLRDPRGVIPREDIQKVTAIQDPEGQPALGIEMTSQGRKRFARLSRRFDRDFLAINLDGVAIMIAQISGPVEGDLMVAWDQFTPERVQELESILNVPRLPTGLVLVSEEEITPPREPESETGSGEAGS